MRENHAFLFCVISRNGNEFTCTFNQKKQSASLFCSINNFQWQQNSSICFPSYMNRDILIEHRYIILTSGFGSIKSCFFPKSPVNWNLEFLWFLGSIKRLFDHLGSSWFWISPDISEFWIKSTWDSTYEQSLIIQEIMNCNELNSPRMDTQRQAEL